jgi:hypothetical protein
MREIPFALMVELHTPSFLAMEDQGAHLSFLQGRVSLGA